MTAKKLILEGLEEHFGFINPHLNKDLDDIQASYIDTGHHFITVDLEKSIVGTGALVKESPDTGRIVRVSVAPNKRCLGIGSAIVNYLIKLGRRSAFNKIVVETNHDWQDAIALYKRCGFQEYARDEESVHMVFEL